MAAILQTRFTNEYSYDVLGGFIFPYGLINNTQVLFRIMAWHQTGDTVLFEPIMA